MSHRFEVLIRESHIDVFGHMNNATYLELFEDARWEWITQNHYGFKQVQEKQIGPIILEIKVKFFKEITLREKITIQTQPMSHDKKVGVVKQQMIKEDGSVACEGEFLIALMDLAKRKIITPTPEWLIAIK